MSPLIVEELHQRGLGRNGIKLGFRSLHFEQTCNAQMVYVPV